MAIAVAVVTALFGTLYLAATGYLIFRDDILAASIARQTRMRDAYEDRIATLRADIDRLTSRQLLDQEAYDAKLNRLLNRQAALDERQDVIAGLSQTVRRAGLGASPPAAPVPDPVPRPDPAKAASASTPLTTGRLETTPPTEAASLSLASLRTEPTAEDISAQPVDTQMRTAKSMLDRLAREQVAYVGDIATSVSRRSAKIASVLTRLGQSVPARLNVDAVGGPYVPLADDADPDTFRSEVSLISGQIERFTTLKRLASQLPLTQPIAHAVITSRFGPRLDPFLGKLALHPGIDFRAPIGFPVHSTAGGTVITAGRNGGYGNMVEIDHGHGVTTRYAHLSAVLVRVGQVVPKGALVGRSGSTGRSTGPHLHYEIRLDGKAIDPMRYIKAGRELASLL